MTAFLRKAEREGEKINCPICAEKGIEIEVHSVFVEDTYGTRFSWKNPDGTSHVKPDGIDPVTQKQKFVHLPNVDEKPKGENPKGENPIRAEIEKCKAWLEQSGDWKIEAAMYHARRELYETTVKDLPENIRGMVVGNMQTCHYSGSVTKPTETWGMSTADSTISSAQVFPQKHAVEGFGANETIGRRNKQPVGTIEDNVRNLILNNPTFFSTKQSNNDKIKLYYEQVLGIDITVIQQHAVESVTRAFRKQLNESHKHYDKEQEFREKYSHD